MIHISSHEWDGENYEGATHYQRHFGDYDVRFNAGSARAATGFNS